MLTKFEIKKSNNSKSNRSKTSHMRKDTDLHNTSKLVDESGLDLLNLNFDEQ